jgi:hypothetical protein
MTHEELLAKISLGEKFEGTTWTIDIDLIVKQLKALREVVKSHKPVACFLLDGSQGTMCIDCRDGFYPCLTIQVIENQLE